MDPARVDALSHWLVFRTHRRALVGGAVAAGAFSALAAPSPVAAVPQQAAICNPATNGNFGAGGNPRYAATFTAGRAGRLGLVEIHLQNNPGSAGAFVVKLLAVNPDTGVPKNKVLATTKVPADSVPEGSDVTLVAPFKKRHATKLVEGKRYAVVISRPKGDSLDWAPRTAAPGPCLDSRFFFSEQQSGAFEAPDGSIDMLFTVFVGF